MRTESETHYAPMKESDADRKRRKAHELLDALAQRKVYGALKVGLKNGEVETLHIDESVSLRD